MADVFLNGHFVSDEGPLISSHDRGFLLGDGLFETLKYSNQHIHFFEAHFERLKNSAKFFSIPFLYTMRSLLESTLELIKRNQLEYEDVAVRITLSRGISERGLDFPQWMKPTLLISVVGYKASKTPVTLYVSNVIRHSQSLLVNHKTLNCLPAVIARRQAIEKGFQDALHINEKNHIACTAAANIFFVNHGNLFTPSIQSGILPGTMRQHVINVCKENDIAVKETEIDFNFMMQSEEAFLTNSLIGLQVIAKIDGQEFGMDSHSLTTHLRSLVE